jgi:hypothetical protein
MEWLPHAPQAWACKVAITLLAWRSFGFVTNHRSVGSLSSPHVIPSDRPGRGRGGGSNRSVLGGLLLGFELLGGGTAGFVGGGHGDNEDDASVDNAADMNERRQAVA